MNYQYWQEISFFLNALDKERVVFEKGSMNAEGMENTRTKMMHTLETLKSGLEQRMDKYQASLVLFPIVAATDEKMQAYDYNSTKVKWPTLQKDFFSSNNAGEIFFKSLDDILDDPNIPNIVFQVYYAMLKRGFQGKYKDSKTQIAKYLDMLKDKVPVFVPLKKKSTAQLPSEVQKKSWIKKWHCYSLSLFLFLLTFGFLKVFAKLQ
ncbi:MAG: DotU family type IV/VI secretion system protein [Candidatus Protochlamydia sp.]|nr:DotU family type IV/VI secretion system protein [Candidatus Protochlamydia sp.]